MELKSLVHWDDNLSVGIEEIDQQHKILVELINRLYTAIVTSTTDKEIHGILNELVQYTVIHFAVEESLMRIFNYPDYDTHKKHHEDLTHQVLDIQAKVLSGEKKVDLELLNFLRAWLTNHIMGEDKLYTPFFLNQGLHAKWSKKTSLAGKIWKFMHLG